MYMIFKNARPQGNKKYLTYEQARQAARKWCRKATPSQGKSNPSMGDYGYVVKRVA